MVWPTLGSRKAKEQNRTLGPRYTPGSRYTQSAKFSTLQGPEYTHRAKVHLTQQILHRTQGHGTPYSSSTPHLRPWYLTQQILNPNNLHRQQFLSHSIHTMFISISLSHKLVSIFSNTQQLTIVTHVSNPSSQSMRYVSSIDSLTHTTSLAYLSLRKQIYNLSIHYSSLPL